MIPEQPSDDDLVVISKSEYQLLIKESSIFRCLKLYGVEEWKHYELAMEGYKNECHP